MVERFKVPVKGSVQGGAMAASLLSKVQRHNPEVWSETGRVLHRLEE